MNMVMDMDLDLDMDITNFCKITKVCNSVELVVTFLNKKLKAL
jgi:hypothetical protein